MLFDASYLAQAWLAVALAASNDREDPVLGFAVHIELYPDGVRLTASDRFLLLSTWVPALGARDGELTPAPDEDEAPMIVATARDLHGRGSGLMAYLRKLTKDEDSPLIEVRLRVDKATDLPDGVMALDGVDAKEVIIEYPGAERITLPVYEGDWPQWRVLLANHHRSKTDVIALHPGRLGALAKLGKMYDGKPILWQFGGRDKLAKIDVAESFPYVHGAVMPTAWLYEVPADGEDSAA